MQLEPGKFYHAKNRAIWCCFRLRQNGEEHAAVDCIQVETCRLESFYLDGRYDAEGKREHTLVEECAYVRDPRNI